MFYICEMKIKTHLEIGNWNMFCLPIPEKKAEQIIKDFGKRIICQVNDASFHCAIQKSKKIGHYISVGKSTKKLIKAEYRDKLELIIKKDETEFKSPMPEEFEEVLKTDPPAQAAFDQLTPGKKRSLMFYVGKAKQIDTRINRALKISEKLKMGFTDLKEMMRP